MEFFIGLAVGLVLSVMLGIGVLCAIRWAVRRRRRNFPSMTKWLAINAKSSAKKYSELFKELKAIKGQIDIQVGLKGPKPLTAEQHGMVLIINGITVLVTQTNVEPKLIDQLIQHGLDYAAEANATTNIKDPSDE